MPNEELLEIPTKQKRRRREKRRRKILLFFFSLFFLLFAVSAALSLSSWLNARNEQKSFDELAALMETEMGTPIEKQTGTQEGKADGIEEPAQAADNRERFAALYELNPDFIGWLAIEDTAINYPVMCTPDDYDYYLRRDFYGAASGSGVPFFGEGCTTDSNNIIIYGHNMKNGTMFSDLTNYSSRDYYSEHPTIFFDTLEKSGTYEIIAIFRDKVHDRSEMGVFRYYDYGGTLTEEQFNEYIANIKSLSLYDTGITAEYGDQLLTLSTCGYHTDNGRFVVVAKRTG